jgi:hypothetical protein
VAAELYSPIIMHNESGAAIRNTAPRYIIQKMRTSASDTPSHHASLLPQYPRTLSSLYDSLAVKGGNQE